MLGKSRKHLLEELEEVMEKHGVADYCILARMLDGTDAQTTQVGMDEISHANRERYLAMMGLMVERLLDYYMDCRQYRVKEDPSDKF